MRPSHLLPFALLAACVSPADDLETSAQEIIGGQTVQVGAYPSVVGLTLGGGLCTGTLVHREWILTAAHCVEGVTPAQVQVIFDDINVEDATQTGQTVTVSAIHSHPGYDTNNLGDNDVAVMKLTTAADRQPTHIHRASPAAGAAVTTVGYGVAIAPETGAGVLRKLNTVTTACTPYQVEDANLLCFDADDGNGTCFGDSGGPTFVDAGGRLEVTGVTSFGADENCTGFDASTKVSAELAFIDMYVPLDGSGGGGGGGGGTGGGGGGEEPDPMDPSDPSDPGGDDRADMITGGCSTGGGSSAGAGLLLLLALALVAGQGLRGRGTR